MGSTKGQQWRPWTTEEDAFLIDHPLMGGLESSKHLDRSVDGIAYRRMTLRKLGKFLPRAVRKPVHSNRENNDPMRPQLRVLLAQTCISCGYLLGPQWFESTGHGPRSKCIRCRGKARGKRVKTTAQVRQSSESKASAQRTTLDSASRHGLPWIEDDHKVLANPDLTITEKAMALGRTYAATAFMTSKEGYRSRVGKGDPTKTEWIINNPIASELGETS